MMLLQQSTYSNITGTGSQVTLGFPHSQFCLRVASPKVREHGHTTPITYELASDTYYGLGVVTLTLSFNPTCIGVPFELVPCNPPRANLPLLCHLHIDTCHVFSNTVAPAVTLLAAHAPHLATLHITGPQNNQDAGCKMLGQDGPAEHYE